MALQIGLIAAMVALAALFLFESRKWRRGLSQITARQHIYRSASALLLEGILLMILLTRTVVPREHPVLWMSYATIAVLLALVLPALALLDVRETLITYRERRRQMISHLIDDGRHEP